MRLCPRDRRGRISKTGQRVGALQATRARPLGGFRSQSSAKLPGPGQPRAQAQTPAGGAQAGLEPTWRGEREWVEQGTRWGPGRGGGGAGLARPRPGSRGLRARGCSSLTAGEVALAPRDVCLRSRGHGGAAAAASRDDSSLWPEPKAAAAAAAAAAALLPASRSSARLGGRREAPNPRRGVPLLRGWTSVPRGGVPGFGRRPLPAPQQSQE